MVLIEYSEWGTTPYGERYLGKYQCDKDEFSNYWKHRPANLTAVDVSLPDGRRWIWFKSDNRWHERDANGLVIHKSS